MTQEGLDFGMLYRAADTSRTVYRALNDTVDRVGILTAAGACGVDRSDLRRALDRRDRGVWVEYAMAIGTLAPFEQRQQIASSFVEPLGFIAASPRPPMSDRERADALEQALVALGPVGQHAADVAMGRKR